MGNSNRIDWAKIERQYRAGMLTIAEIARENGNIPESNIRYHAKTKGWKRDLTDEMRSRTRTKMVENLAKIYPGGEKEIAGKIKVIEDEEIIEQASRTQVNVVREHQKTVGQGHSLTMRMLDELDATTTHRGQLEDMIKSDVAPIRQRAMINAVSLNSRAVVMRDLANAARVWVQLERQAFNIADDRTVDKDQRKLEEMTAEQLRKEILEDANKMGLDLSELGKGVAPRTERVNPHSNGSGNGKIH